MREKDEEQAARVDQQTVMPPERATAASNEAAPTEAQIAEWIARRVHHGQREPYGRLRPYIEHVEAVVAGVNTPAEHVVAWLHDVLEDSELTPCGLRSMGISGEAISSLLLLTRDKRRDTYHAYIGKLLVSDDAVAQAVKLADLRDHLHESCPAKLRPRYEDALEALEAGELLSEIQRAREGLADCEDDRTATGLHGLHGNVGGTMGQALDRSGNVLGEAFGETKREVFDKLTEKFADAHEIRIASLGQAAAEMPRYRCHKEVHALKIRAVTHNSVLAQLSGNESDGSALITPDDAGFAEFRVTAEYVRKHNPQAGGYYVVYEDGYASFSPAKAFEDGYTRI